MSNNQFWHTRKKQNLTFTFAHSFIGQKTQRCTCPNYVCVYETIPKLIAEHLQTPVTKTLAVPLQTIQMETNLSVKLHFMLVCCRVCVHECDDARRSEGLLTPWQWGCDTSRRHVTQRSECAARQHPSVAGSTYIHTLSNTPVTPVNDTRDWQAPAIQRTNSFVSSTVQGAAINPRQR
jgi:hypothetical protein